MDMLSGYKIPQIGLGTSKCDDKDLEKALDKALEIGYRHLDSAFYYKNDHVIRKVLNQWYSAGKLTRSDIFLTSKLPMNAMRPELVEKQVLTTLEKLNTDYLDLYLIHFPICVEARQENGRTMFETIHTDHLKVWRKLEEQVQAGRIRSLGVSNFNRRQLEKLIASNLTCKISNLQIELHLYLQQPELVGFCHAHNITVTAYGPLGSPGYNQYLISNGLPAKESLADILTDATVARISGKHRKTPAQVALRFLIQNNIIVIPKSVTERRLRENFQLFDFQLDKDDMDDLTRLDMAEKGRIFTYIEYPGFQDHPEWPFQQPTNKIKASVL